MEAGFLFIVKWLDHRNVLITYMYLYLGTMEICTVIILIVQA